MKKLITLIKSKGKSKKEITEQVKNVLESKELITKNGKLKSSSSTPKYATGKQQN